MEYSQKYIDAKALLSDSECRAQVSDVEKNEAKIFVEAYESALQDANVERSVLRMTINDGYCAYEYPLRFTDSISIKQVQEKIFELFGLPSEKGKLVSKEY